MPVIQVDYDKLKALTNVVRDEEDKVRRTLQAVRSQMETLQGGGWQSGERDAAPKFYGVMEDEILPALERLAFALGRNAETIERIAAHFREADERNNTLFRV